MIHEHLHLPGVNLLTGYDPEYDKLSTPGYPWGAWILNSAALLLSPSATLTPKTAMFSAPLLSFAEPPGDWFSIVHSCIVPSARSSNEPVPSPPRGTADRIPEGGCLVLSRCTIPDVQWSESWMGVGMALLSQQQYVPIMVKGMESLHKKTEKLLQYREVMSLSSSSIFNLHIQGEVVFTQACSLYGVGGPYGWSSIRVRKHEATRSITTPPWMLVPS